ncbi:MAG: hypothetical protein QGG40_04925 [Myxococcota bacterium]|nr:hypothetical protein [Myxococcota bacterium]
MLIALLALPVLAAEPVTVSRTVTNSFSSSARCEAVWIGPSDGCLLTGTWIATGTGKDGDKARKAATSRLVKAVEVGARASEMRVAGTIAAAHAANLEDRCSQVVADNALLTCHSDSDLLERRICFTDLPPTYKGSPWIDPPRSGSLELVSCWDGSIMEMEGVGWKVQEKSRKKLCKDSLQGNMGAGMSELDSLDCFSRCLQTARVRCLE